jgi:hypothetical protein
MAAAVAKVSVLRTRLQAEAPSKSSASCSPSCSGLVAPASRAVSVSRAAKAFLQSRACTRAGWALQRGMRPDTGASAAIRLSGASREPSRRHLVGGDVQHVEVDDQPKGNSGSLQGCGRRRSRTTSAGSERIS